MARCLADTGRVRDERQLGGVTAKGEQVALGILDAAIETIADHGAGGASMQRIADRAGVDKSVLRYYFGDRDGVFSAVTNRIGDRLVGDLETALADITDPGIGFEVGFEVLWGAVVANPRLHGAYLELVAASIGDDSLRAHVVAVRDRYDHVIQERATFAEAEGFVWRMPKETMSALVLATLQGLTMDYLQRGETPQLADALAEFRVWMQGLAAQRGA